MKHLLSVALVALALALGSAAPAAADAVGCRRANVSNVYFDSVYCRVRCGGTFAIRVDGQHYTGQANGWALKTGKAYTLKLDLCDNGLAFQR